MQTPLPILVQSWCRLKRWCPDQDHVKMQLVDTVCTVTRKEKVLIHSCIMILQAVLCPTLLGVFLLLASWPGSPSYLKGYLLCGFSPCVIICSCKVLRVLAQTVAFTISLPKYEFSIEWILWETGLNSATTILVTQILRVIWHPMLRKALVSRLKAERCCSSPRYPHMKLSVGALATTSAKGFPK